MRSRRHRLMRPVSQVLVEHDPREIRIGRAIHRPRPPGVGKATVEVTIDLIDRFRRMGQRRIAIYMVCRFRVDTFYQFIERLLSTDLGPPAPPTVRSKRVRYQSTRIARNSLR